MIHLRMTGQIFMSPDYVPDKHAHLHLDFDGLPVHYRDVRKFGRWSLVDHPEHPSAISHVGPDMLSVRFKQWDQRCAHRRAPWKAVLLDQGVAAGMGNIYADEALFVAGVHPLDCPADTGIEKRKAVLKASKQVLRLSLRHGGTTFLDYRDFSGQPGNFRRKLRVFQRQGEP
jgi:formamidopyrimidine-DNA glycosylase